MAKQGMSIVRKITTKNMGLTDPKTLEEICQGAPGEEIPVLRVVGKIRSATPGQTGLGSYVSFSGEIVAVNLITGEEKRAPSMILPSMAEMLVDAALSAAKAKDPNASATIALDVTLTEHVSSYQNGQKYKWGVIGLSKDPIDDPLSQLLHSFGDLPMLEAPKKTRKK
jgi:hypothetical protein